jgi:hypothetical protein
MPPCNITAFLQSQYFPFIDFSSQYGWRQLTTAAHLLTTALRDSLKTGLNNLNATSTKMVQQWPMDPVVKILNNQNMKLCNQDVPDIERKLDKTNRFVMMPLILCLGISTTGEQELLIVKLSLGCQVQLRIS